MSNQPNCHTSLAEQMLLDIYTVLCEASQMKPNNMSVLLVTNKTWITLLNDVIQVFEPLNQTKSSV